MAGPDFPEGALNGDSIWFKDQDIPINMKQQINSATWLPKIYKFRNWIQSASYTPESATKFFDFDYLPTSGSLSDAEYAALDELEARTGTEKCCFYHVNDGYLVDHPNWISLTQFLT